MLAAGVLVFLGALWGTGSASDERYQYDQDLGAWEGTSVACTDNLGRVPGESGTMFLARCTDTACAKGAVYGSGTYADNSSLCRAAVHAGAIEATGGTFWVTVAPSQLSYLASTQHGVTSLASGKRARSFTVAPLEPPPPNSDSVIVPRTAPPVPVPTTP